MNPWVRFPKGEKKDAPAGIPACAGQPAERPSKVFHFAFAKHSLCSWLPIRFPPFAHKKQSFRNCFFGTPGGRDA